MHGPRRRSGADPPLVRDALAAGGDLPGDAQTPRIRDATPVWSELAIRRTTPALLGLFSIVTLLAHQRMRRSMQAVRKAAWYRKSRPTFADALALVRKELWAHEEQTFCGSPSATDTVKVPREFVERLTDAVCYVA